MGALKEFPKSQPPSGPEPPFPPAASAHDILREKRIVRVTIRLSDTLRFQLQRLADENGTTLSDMLCILAARETAAQASQGQTLPDTTELETALREARRAYLDGILTDCERVRILRPLTKFQTRVLAGKRRMA